MLKYSSIAQAQKKQKNGAKTAKFVNLSSVTMLGPGKVKGRGVVTKIEKSGSVTGNKKNRASGMWTIKDQSSGRIQVDPTGIIQTNLIDFANDNLFDRFVADHFA